MEKASGGEKKKKIKKFASIAKAQSDMERNFR